MEGPWGSRIGLETIEGWRRSIRKRLLEIGRRRKGRRNTLVVSPWVSYLVRFFSKKKYGFFESNSSNLFSSHFLIVVLPSAGHSFCHLFSFYENKPHSH